MNKQYATRKISKTQITKIVKDLGPEEPRTIRMDDEKCNRIEIEKCILGDEPYIIKKFPKFGWKESAIYFAKTQKEVIETIGAFLPNYLKLRNNF